MFLAHLNALLDSGLAPFLAGVVFGFCLGFATAAWRFGPGRAGR